VRTELTADAPIATVRMTGKPPSSGNDITATLQCTVGTSHPFSFPVTVKGKNSQQSSMLSSTHNHKFFSGHRAPPIAVDGPVADFPLGVTVKDSCAASWYNSASDELQSAMAVAKTRIDDGMIKRAVELVVAPISLKVNHSKLQRDIDAAKKASVVAPAADKSKKYMARRGTRFELRNAHMLRYGIDFRKGPVAESVSSLRLR
jgi:hypothetical protein